MRKPFMRLSAFALLVLVAHTVLGQSGLKVTITGRVLDATTGQPLTNVNVFISNSTLGSATNDQGRYEIRGVPPGRYELIASMIGYEVQKFKLELVKLPQKEMNFQLLPKALSGPELEVSAKEDKKWKKNFEKFTKLFLGTSKNSEHCRILNREVLSFKKDSKTPVFKAEASAPLRIENHATGYDLYFVLEKFEAQGSEVRYLGQARFEERIPKDAKESKQWQKIRLKTYQGSLRHFLTSLYSNQHQREGFVAELVPDIYADKFSPHRAHIKRHDLFSSGKLPNERFLNFNNMLEVIYKNEMEEEAYIDFRVANDLRLRNARPERIFVAQEPQSQKSWIMLKRVDVLVDVSGHILEPLSVQIYGYWAWERIGDLLPIDYQPLKPLVSTSASPAELRDYYEDGLAKLGKGKWQEAIKEWLDGYEALQLQKKSDPRIAFAFIELVASKQALIYYEKACEMYLWGLAQDVLKTYRKEIMEEIERISPILEKTVYEKWKKDADKKRPRVMTALKTFWIERDPTPTTVLNERLTEHWERIAYAKKNFQNAANTIYGTDDRGVIYVKYGAPDRSQVVSLGNDPAEIYTVAGFFGIPGNMIGEFRRGIQDVLYYPECEVWSYRRLGTNEPVIYIFGNRGGIGSFGLRSSIEEFIPDRAFRSTRYTANIIPGAVIELMYYSRLSSFDLSFASRRDEMELELERDSGAFVNKRTGKLVRQKFKMLDENNPIRRYAPEDQYDSEKIRTPIELVANRARFLDEKNRPQLMFIAFAFPPQSLTQNPLNVLDENLQPEYDLRYTMLVRDADLDNPERYFAKPIGNLDNTAIFILPHKKEHTHFTIAAESIRTTAGAQKYDYKDPLKIGQVFFDKVETLKPDPKKLEVSDLVLGVAPPDSFDSRLLPFPLIPTRRIWQQDLLKVYFEVYHLQLGKDGIGKFTVDSRIIRLKKKGKKFSRQELVATTFEFSSHSMTSKENFGVSIAHYKPGNYELEVEVADRVSGKKKKTSAAFEIVR